MTTNSIWNPKFKVQGNAIGYIIWELNNKIEVKMNSILGECKITRFQFFVLMGLNVAKENKLIMTQDQLSTFINSNSMMVSKVLRQLEKNGYIERIENPKDTRSKIVSITKQGGEIFQQAQINIQTLAPVIESNITGGKQNFVHTLENLIKLLK
jgi:DNA-binding MarR family transcriptional regulator